jgi:hypothetical protein
MPNLQYGAGLKPDEAVKAKAGGGAVGGGAGDTIRQVRSQPARHSVTSHTADDARRRRAAACKPTPAGAESGRHADGRRWAG